ncbi:antibiotic biosynthesis monooxygenase [Tamlana fucoidanivorans]|uniref:Antibiotic biosynthesis monooxygenase n=1 Tax=Allotamlana fucoidanivorans TaxID=2583814 RepID=A0A5C4SDZ7_9FLAO|nr:antibiotic biosynthesis monooxygenase family protein [Tamlana fucoidanivorans]TNJ41213.1 antibiotic biosynthesis monooxygenase [Tamlana fucoidanivorans]
MLVRIVKMGFDTAYVDTFLRQFHASKHNIRQFEGCMFLELYQDQQDPSIFFTYSYWQTAAHLEAYRHSDLFKSVWSKTKPLFNRKPEAWSVDKLESLE